MQINARARAFVLVLVAVVACTDAGGPVQPVGADASTAGMTVVRSTMGDPVRLRISPAQTSDHSPPVDWTVEDPSVAVIEDGLIVPLAPGSTRLRSSIAAADPSGTILRVWGPVRVSGLAIVSAGLTPLEVGAAVVPVARLSYSNGASVVLRATVKWSVVGPSNVIAISGGEVRALAPGTARLIARVGGASDSLDLTVTDSAGANGYEADVHVQLGQALRPVNRRVLGSNVQWVNGGDGLLTPGTTSFDAGALSLARTLAPAVLRYPGGSQGDTYHWQNGVGPLAERGNNELFFAPGQSERVLFGTAEFLELARTIGAEPLITVNVATGTASEAAAWVRAVNRTGVVTASGGRTEGRVRFWEIDNEPYLRNDARPEHLRSASDFAGRASEFIRQMRSEDPSILVGLPLSSDTVGVLMLEQQTPGFAATVLREVGERIDYVSLHNAYFPFLWNPGEAVSDADLFQATMSAAGVVERDFAQVRSMLRRYRPAEAVKLAVTEYGALFSLGGPRDGYIATLGGALYVADLLRLFATTEDLLMANHWSLSDNWYFGSISKQLPQSASMGPRPVYQVLAGYERVLRGDLLETSVESPTFDSRAVGLLPASSGVPLVGVLATQEGATTRVMLLNRSSDQEMSVMLSAPRGAPAQRISAWRELTSSQVYDPADQNRGLYWTVRSTPSVEGAAPVAVTLPPHSLTWIELVPAR